MALRSVYLKLRYQNVAVRATPGAGQRLLKLLQSFFIIILLNQRQPKTRSSLLIVRHGIARIARALSSIPATLYKRHHHHWRHERGDMSGV
jgi:hypothetical protein